MSESCLHDCSIPEELINSIKLRILSAMDCSVDMTDEQILVLIDEELRDRKRKGYMSLSFMEDLRRELFYSLRKLDVLQSLIDDETITEIMVNGTNSIFYEKQGRLYRWNRSFSSVEKLEDIIQRIVSKTNRMVNERSPIVDTRLENGARVNVVLNPISIDGPAVTIRRFPDKPIRMKNLIEFGSLTEDTAKLLKEFVIKKKNILICGGTGTGKTTFLNALSEYIGEDERVVTIEDSAELNLKAKENLVRLECRENNTEGVGEISIRDLIKTSLRMRPDRIIIGEVRGSEAVDLLQVLNTGHSGSLTTLHANSCADIFSRLETLVLMGMNIPVEAIRRQIAAAIDIIVYLVRMKDRSRKVKEIYEISGYREGEFILNPRYILKGEEFNDEIN